MKTRLAALLTLILFLSGCTSGNFNSIFRNEKLQNGQSILTVDAKQRIISVTPSPLPNPYRPDMRIVCSEPSPDAFSVFSNSLSESADYQKFALSLAMQSSEKGAGLGIRTPSVQALRDAMYRVCEGYAAGAINPYLYEILLQRYQTILVGLIAIEHLTTAVATSDIKISSQPEGKVSGDSSVGEQKGKQASTNPTSLKTEPGSATKHLDKSKVDTTTASSNASGTGESSQKGKNEITGKQKLSPGNEEQIGNDSANILRNGIVTTDAIANTVRDIVSWIVNADNAKEFCIQLLNNPLLRPAEPPPSRTRGQVPMRPGIAPTAGNPMSSMSPSPQQLPPSSGPADWDNDYMQLQIRMRTRCLWILDPPNSEQTIAERATPAVRRVLDHLQLEDIHLILMTEMPENSIIVHNDTEAVDQWRRLIAIGLAEEFSQKELEDYNKKEKQKYKFVVRAKRLISDTHEFLVDSITNLVLESKTATKPGK
jgi:hypothetical protein